MYSQVYIEEIPFRVMDNKCNLPQTKLEYIFLFSSSSVNTTSCVYDLPGVDWN